MIRLTINSTSNPEIHLFDKTTILIGSDASVDDLILNHKDIQPTHLKISLKNGLLLLNNEHNDPFVVVNGHPFGKKMLSSGDTIDIHGTPILFEKVADETSPDDREENEEKSESPFENPLTHFSLSFEKEVKAFEEKELEDHPLELYLKDLESQAQDIKPEKKRPTSLKDDYLKDLDDDYPGKKNQFPDEEPSHLIQAWKWIILFIVSISFIFCIIGGVVYLSLSDKTEVQETKATQGVADLAMALTYAQLNHLHSHNPNWSDPDFLKANLAAVIPNTPSYGSYVDAQGQFNCCPYTLRIYTSSDLTRFLLIAQPDPNLVHWIIPKSMIVVDSDSMELRMVKDVRSLNRLLTNPDPLIASNGKEITALVKKGTLVDLKTLAKEAGRSDFEPPAALTLRYPDADHYIFNAPRYYHLGQDLIKKITGLANSKTSSQEIANIKQELANYSIFNHLVFYSSEGKPSALLFKRELMTFAPSENFLFGYLNLNERGQIEEANLLSDNENHQIEIQADQIVMEENVPETATKATEEVLMVDINDPIYIQLHALVSERQVSLKPLLERMMTLIQDNLLIPSPHFSGEFQALSQRYLEMEEAHQATITDTLKSLYLQYEELPIEKFISMIEHFKLHQLIQKQQKENITATNTPSEKMEVTLSPLFYSQSLQELHLVIKNLMPQLSFDHMNDPKELISYHHKLRNATLEQLERLILLSSPSTFKPEERDALQKILDQERLIHPEEKEFFLEEFDAAHPETELNLKGH